MIKLYVKETCPFCQKVKAFVEEKGVKVGEDIEYVDAADGTPGREVVLSLGGKGQVPFLVDEETSMYESDAIIEYIGKKFS